MEQQLVETTFPEELDSALLAQRVLQQLKLLGCTVATAESCTGGLLAKRLTDPPGSSAAFVGGLVTYTDAQKTALLAVPAALLATYGAVSQEVACAMAQGALAQCGADYALATTGLAGPEGDGSGKPVGCIYVALAGENLLQCHQLQLHGSRAQNRSQAANYALELLARHLAEKC